MVAIASYYASVGVGVDRNSLKSVQNYLDSIQKKMQNFQKNIIKTSDLSLRINNISVKQTNLRRSIRATIEGQNYKLNSVSVGRFIISAAKLRGSIREALGTGTGGAIRLNEFSINQKALVSAINNALNKE